MKNSISISVYVSNLKFMLSKFPYLKNYQYLKSILIGTVVHSELTNKILKTSVIPQFILQKEKNCH